MYPRSPTSTGYTLTSTTTAHTNGTGPDESHNLVVVGAVMLSGMVFVNMCVVGGWYALKKKPGTSPSMPILFLYFTLSLSLSPLLSLLSLPPPPLTLDQQRMTIRRQEIQPVRLWGPCLTSSCISRTFKWVNV